MDVCGNEFFWHNDGSYDGNAWPDKCLVEKPGAATIDLVGVARAMREADGTVVLEDERGQTLRWPVPPARPPVSGQPVGARKQTERDEQLGAVARAKVMQPGIGDPLWYPGEAVVRSSTRSVQIYGEDEDLWLLWTSSPDGKQGRLLIAQGPQAGYLYGGAHWVEEAGRRCVSSIWIEPEYRQSARHTRTGRGTGVDLAGILAEMASAIGISCIFRPVSTAGARWAKRHGFAQIL